MPAPNLTARMASLDDVPLIVMLNRQLIEDQGHDNPATDEELLTRMERWLRTDYLAALVYSDEKVAAYALWRAQPDHPDDIHLRQFFVVREHRRSGVGLRAMRLLTTTYWQGQNLHLDVLVGNERGRAFWAKAGFTDYAVMMRRKADH